MILVTVISLPLDYTFIMHPERERGGGGVGLGLAYASITELTSPLRSG